MNIFGGSKPHAFNRSVALIPFEIFLFQPSKFPSLYQKREVQADKLKNPTNWALANVEYCTIRIPLMRVWTGLILFLNSVSTILKNDGNKIFCLRPSSATHRKGKNLFLA